MQAAYEQHQAAYDPRYAGYAQHQQQVQPQQQQQPAYQPVQRFGGQQQQQGRGTMEAGSASFGAQAGQYGAPQQQQLQPAAPQRVRQRGSQPLLLAVLVTFMSCSPAGWALQQLPSMGVSCFCTLCDSNSSCAAAGGACAAKTLVEPSGGRACACGAPGDGAATGVNLSPFGTPVRLHLLYRQSFESS